MLPCIFLLHTCFLFRWSLLFFWLPRVFVISSCFIFPSTVPLNSTGGDPLMSTPHKNTHTQGGQHSTARILWWSDWRTDEMMRIPARWFLLPPYLTYLLTLTLPRSLRSKVGLSYYFSKTRSLKVSFKRPFIYTGLLLEGFSFVCAVSQWCFVRIWTNQGNRMMTASNKG